MIEWTGISPIGFQFRFRRGESPSYAHITGWPVGTVQQTGDLVLRLSNGQSQVFRDCKLVGGRQDGAAPSWMIADRRWKWDESPWVDIDWNVPWLGGLPLTGGTVRERAPQDIARDLFTLLGENSVDVSVIPNTSRPPFRFQGPANKALAKLCDMLGCEPGIAIDGTAKVFKRGADQKPTGLPTRHITHPYPASSLGKVTVEFGPTMFQDDLALESYTKHADIFSAAAGPETVAPVGIWGNWRGDMYPLAGSVTNTVYPEAKLDEHWNLLRLYRIVGTWRTTGTGRPTRGFDIANHGPINEIEQIIPIPNLAAETTVNHRADRTTTTISTAGFPLTNDKRYPYRSRRPTIQGVFCTLGLLGISHPYPTGDVAGFRPYAVYPHPFRVMPDLTVEFQHPVFEMRAKNANPQSYDHFPAPCVDLKLTCAFNLRANTGQLVRHQLERNTNSGGSLNTTIRVHDMFLRYESVETFQSPPNQPSQPATQDWISNQTHIESVANRIIDDIVGVGQTPAQKEHAICDGLLGIEPNGTVSEVAWRWLTYDVQNGVSTEVVAND